MEKHKKKYLKDYKQPEYLIDKIDLRFDLKESNTQVISTMKIRRNIDVADKDTPLVFDCECGPDNIVSIIAEDMVLCPDEYEINANFFILPNVPEQFTLEITTILNPQQNTSLEGLYKSGSTFCTQCEAEGFRKITCFPDRPDVMTRFSCIIIADKTKYPVLLSNGNLIKKGDLPNGRHFVQWEDPFKKPSYLFALVAGDLVCIEDNFITCSGRNIHLKIYVEHENRHKCGHAMQSLKQAMKWDEERFGREYDLDLYQIVAVNDFNMGAMENKGLNVFNSKYVLAKPETATDTDFMNIQGVIGHEYFHNWTGNRITLKNWFQLSLKEGLTVFRDQEFSSDMNSRGVKRITDVKRLKAFQFPEDSGPMAHPVRPESYIEMNNFYTATVYNKGAELIRMIFQVLGKEVFRKGMDSYFEKFDGQAITIEDFIKTMEEVSETDFSQFRLWYSQSGTPVVTIKREYDPATEKLFIHLSQDLAKDQHLDHNGKQSLQKPMHIPVKLGFVNSRGMDITKDVLKSEDSDVFQFKTERETFVFNGIPPGTILSVFREFSAPVKINNDFSSKELAFLMANDSDEFNRWDAAQQLFLREVSALVGMIQKGKKGKDWENGKNGKKDKDVQESKKDHGTNSAENINSGDGGNPLKISKHIGQAFKKALEDTDADRALLAMILTIPGESEIGEHFKIIDVDAVHGARSFLKKTFAVDFEQEFYDIIDRCHAEKSCDLSREAMADRSLKNLALSYLGTLGTKHIAGMIYDRFCNASTMTDEIAALSILCNIDSEFTRSALEKFYLKWKSDPLVIDKWFEVQAGSILPDTLEKLEKLTKHPDFSLKNPNRIRSLIGVFATQNTVNFHRPDGEGYAFVADHIKILDQTNPQISSRLVSAFNNWKRYDRKRKEKMHTELEKIIALPNLSTDTYEIVSRALK